jgi:hypothetical protein
VRASLTKRARRTRTRSRLTLPACPNLPTERNLPIRRMLHARRNWLRGGHRTQNPAATVPEDDEKDWNGLRIACTPPSRRSRLNARHSHQAAPSPRPRPCAPFTSLLHLELERLCGFSSRHKRNLPLAEVQKDA